MKYRTYPKTDITVSEIGFGLWTTSTGWWGDMTDDAAIALIRDAHDRYGVTLFDAADTYANGRSEEQLGNAFEGRRDKVIYSTKFGYDFYNFAGERTGQNEIPADFSPSFVRFALEQSLKRLKTDYIDIYSVHNAHLEQIHSDELFALLEEFKSEGKILSYGVALGPAIGWLYEGIDAARKRNITNVQMIWNMLESFPGDAMLRAADEAAADTGYQIRVPHSSGMLEGKYTLDTVFAPTDHRSHRPRQWLLNGIKKIETLRFLESSQRTLGQAAIQWLLAAPRAMTILPNIYDAEQLAEFAAAPDTARLTNDELARIAELAATNFGIGAEQNRYKGTMTEEAYAEATAEFGGGLSATRVFTTAAPAPIGPYNQAVTIDGLVFCSGQIAIDPVVGALIEGDVARQTQQVMSNIAAVLSAAGATFADVVKTTIFLIDMADFATVNPIYGAAFSGGIAPARSTVAVSALPLGARVEIEVVARIAAR